MVAGIMGATTTAASAAFGALRAVPEPLDGQGADVVSEAARAATLAQNLAGASRLAAAHAMVEHYRRVTEDGGPSYARLDPADRARDHLAAALALTGWHAGRLVTAAQHIHGELRLLRKAVDRGMVPEQAAVDVACGLARVPAEVCSAVESDVVGRLCRDLAGGHRPSRTALQALIEAALERHDPAAAQDAVDAAAEKRSVRFRPERAGMMSMWARLPVSDAEKLRQRIEAVARAAHESGHPRGLEQLRADALVALGDPATNDIAEPLSTPDMEPGGGRDDGAGAGASFRVSVISGVAAGLPNRVEFVRGAYSSLDWLCQELLESAGARARFEVVDPAPGVLDRPDTALRYRIAPDLAERIRLRDGTCRHPGCTVAAEHCDVDHVIAFDQQHPEFGGPTCEWNLVCLCRRHHREKTFGGNAYRPGPLGELVITTDTGHQHRTAPSGPLAAARDRLLEHAWREHIDRLCGHDDHLTNPPGPRRSPA